MSGSNSGWIKLHRQILESRYGKNLEIMGMFASLLLMANHKKGFTYDGTMINPGQFMVSKLQLSKLFSLSESKVRRILTKLEIDGQISVKSSTKNTIITITNWDKYQNDYCDDDEQATNERRTTDEQAATNKNDNNNKNNNIYSSDDAIAPNDDALKVIETLNHICGTKFTASKTNLKHINARLREKFVLNDFERVIQAKYREWSQNADMAQYLRPQTLFGAKFESYLMAAKSKPKNLTDKLQDFFASSGISGIEN
jgi:uncharacterized phage protein (TIGR02220 family)